MQQPKDRARRIDGESIRGSSGSRPGPISVPTAASVNAAVRSHVYSRARTIPATRSAARSRVSVAAATAASASAPGSSSRDEQRRVSARLRQRTGAGGHERNAGGHRLEARQPEPLVARGHHDHAGARVQPGQEFLGDVAEPADARDVAAEVAAVRAGEHELEPVVAERASDRFERSEVLALRDGADDERIWPLERVAATRGRRIRVRREPLIDPLRHDDDRVGVRAEELDQLAAGEPRRGEHEPGAPGEQRQDPAVIGDERARVGLRVAERRRVVDDDDVAPARRRERGSPATGSAQRPRSGPEARPAPTDARRGARGRAVAARPNTGRGGAPAAGARARGTRRSTPPISARTAARALIATGAIAGRTRGAIGLTA